jgi:hypothetical protein
VKRPEPSAPGKAGAIAKTEPLSTSRQTAVIKSKKCVFLPPYIDVRLKSYPVKSPELHHYTTKQLKNQGLNS